MAEFKYPTNNLDDSGKLLSLLGSHWSNVYQGQGLVESYTFARAQEAAQNHLDVLEALASISRFEVPIFHRDNWYFLTILESEANSQLLEYGDDAVYGLQPDSNILYEYGIQHALPAYRFSSPDNLVDATAIYNRITDPSRTLVRGVDFLIERGRITLRFNPFEDDYFVKRNIYSGSEVVDREIGLWVFQGDFDYEHVYNHFGNILTLKLQSSEEYRALVNSVMDALAKGTTEKEIQLALSAITGNPVVREAEETVELVQVDNNNLVIVTDKHSYLFPTTASAAVSVGDVVTAGQSLTNTLTFYDLNTGVTSSDLFAVSLGEGFLGADYIDAITFVNQSVSLVVDTTGTKTRVEFEVGGFPPDVSAFWDSVHAQGIARGKTLANMLDTRTSPVGEPTAGDLPTTINPLEFLVTNLLRFNAYVVKIKASGVRGNIGLNNSRLFRRIVPPWTAMIILVELETDGDIIDISYVSEDLTSFQAMSVADIIDPATYVSESVAVRHVEGICQ